ncbi:MAG: NAD-dependent epimerase/dehydratase family protein [Akkermansiaceae bacterium]|jgi:nucleoside-diphosphate-sugar epimerase|nr:NAD-dependent epimerase/dehydratase family protein [Akkermansiaceae bacterium]
MRLLLIGHGYLGAAVARVFREAGWDVMPFSLSGGEGSLACDVADRAAVDHLPVADFIIHCAASGRGGAEAYQRVYVDGCRNLTEKFPGVPFLFTSSTSVYSQTDGSVVTEESPTEPDRETGRLLLEAERITLDAGGIVARLAGIYGPGRSVILRKFLSGEAVIEEDGRRYLNQIHRDDAARAILHLATSGVQKAVFNVSDSMPLTQIECYRRLSEIFDLPMPPSGPRDLDRKRGWTHKRVSNAKLQACGWQPIFPCFIDAATAIAPTL